MLNLRGLKEVFESAMAESAKPGMDYKKQVYCIIFDFRRWVDLVKSDYLPFVADYHRVCVEYLT